MRREILFAYAFLIVGVLDTLGLLGGAFDIGERVISSVLLLFMWYELDLPKHLFGKSNRAENIAFLGIFFVLSLKNLLYHFGGFLPPGIISAASYWSLVAGFVALNVFLAYIALKKEFHRKSVLQSAIRFAQNYLPMKFESDVLQFIALNFISITFFLFIFDPISQWLLVSLDKSLIVIALAYLAFHARDALKSSVVKKVSDAEDMLVKTLLDVFKANVRLALSLVVLVFLLSEIGFFLVPLFTGAFDAQITDVAGGGPYLSVMQLASQSTGSFALPAYALAMLAFVLFISIPAYLLISNVLGKKPSKSAFSALAPIALGSFLFYFATGLFHVERIASKALIGVTMWLTPFSHAHEFWLYLSLMAMGTLAVAAFLSKRVKSAAGAATVLISLVFFLDYFAKYFVSAFEYFSSRLLIDPLVAVIFTNYLLVTIVFFAVTAMAFMRFCSKAAVQLMKGYESTLVYLLAVGFIVAMMAFKPQAIGFGAVELIEVLTRPALIGFIVLAGMALAARKKREFAGLAMFFIANALILFIAHIAFAGLSWMPGYDILSLLLPGIVMLVFSWMWLNPKKVTWGGALAAALIGLAVGALSFVSGETASLVFVESPWAWIVLFSAFTALAEEAFFRGLLYGALREKNSFMKSAVVSSVFFVGAHLAKFPGVEVVASLFVAGMAFAWIREKHSIMLAVTAHFLSNVVLLTLLYI